VRPEFDDPSADVRGRIEAAIAPIMGEYANADAEGDGFYLDRWVLVCSLAQVDAEATMTTLHSSGMPGWMIRGLLSQGRVVSMNFEREAD
jgi:hypothetical protein